ncbi:hypothetical protein HYP99_gp098 [Sinorhizobium phage ort11]|uniref:Uncharacterized protein n=1 Tax=Sinorhizobium phage ort11 TaxID=2599764 RepID=A0A5C2H3T3_9CAUD|nr:hypothetical protein HYP99_gp098 [Sinorhizobium phage ort11]QEP29895.1 hypothetical protein Smphiort11_097 [Sinorhizobium phage ort11]
MPRANQFQFLRKEKGRTYYSKGTNLYCFNTDDKFYRCYSDGEPNYVIPTPPPERFSDR